MARLKNVQMRRASTTVKPDLIATEILMFPSKSSRAKNDSDLRTAIPSMGRQLL